MTAPAVPGRPATAADHPQPPPKDRHVRNHRAPQHRRHHRPQVNFPTPSDGTYTAAQFALEATNPNLAYTSGQQEGLDDLRARYRQVAGRPIAAGDLIAIIPNDETSVAPRDETVLIVVDPDTGTLQLTSHPDDWHQAPTVELHGATII